ncbi:hypothetical protein HHX47_DHR3001127 [Lentinula edodes]|nr:hypothetical protein HHX47_DHR3001127 [Lentinula edodes]
MAQLSDCESLLSTTRINRLLRPLRNKCSTLAVLGTRTASLSGCTTTYSSTKSFTQPDIPPLRILSLPASTTGLDETGGEWSRKIYAVRNAFNDIVEKTAGPRVQSGGDSIPRLPSLSTLCALVIGEHAEPDIEEDTTRFEEECSVDVVETLYKEIPALYRGEVENSELLLQRYAKDALHEYRNVLIDRVEDAEKRCYGSLDGGLLDIMNSPSVQRQKEWGDMASGRSKSKYTRRRQRPHSNENQYRVETRSSNQGSACRNDRGSTHPNKRPRLMPHRVSSFTSLLSNALSNHVVLHEERDHLENGLVNRECLNDRVDVVGHLQTDVGIEDLYGEDFECLVPSSDDCLDLLAYGISSPV